MRGRLMRAEHAGGKQNQVETTTRRDKKQGQIMRVRVTKVNQITVARKHAAPHMINMQVVSPMFYKHYKHSILC